MVEEKQYLEMPNSQRSDPARDLVPDQDWWALTRKSGILLTKNLILRKLQPTDAKPIAKLANNKKVSSMTSRLPHPYTLEHAEEFIARAGSAESHGCAYAVTLAKTADFIGCCSLSPTEREIGPALGYWLGEPFWGNGYATEAAHTLVDLAFKTTNHDRVNASCRVINPASRKVLEKCGFQHSESGMSNSISLGSSIPVDFYVLDRSTWISLKSWGENQ